MTSDKAFFYFKISLIGSVVVLSLTFFLTFTLVQHSRDLRVLAQFYTEQAMKSEQQSEVVPFESEDSLKSSRLNRGFIDEMLLRYYVETRYSSIPDSAEMTRRWGGRSYLARLSTPAIYSDFANGLEKRLKNLPSSVVTVDILQVKQDARDANLYYIDFDIYTTSRTGEVAGIQKKTAAIKITHNLKRKLFRTDFSNPYGTLIRTFSETDRKE